MNDTKLSALESRAIRHALEAVENKRVVEDLSAQVEQLIVTSRSEKKSGYYVDFRVPPSLSSQELQRNYGVRPIETRAYHPDRKNVIFFLLYHKEGLLTFMEAASTDQWPDDEAQIGFDM